MVKKNAEVYGCSQSGYCPECVPAKVPCSHASSMIVDGVLWSLGRSFENKDNKWVLANG